MQSFCDIIFVFALFFIGNSLLGENIFTFSVESPWEVSELTCGGHSERMDSGLGFIFCSSEFGERVHIHLKEFVCLLVLYLYVFCYIFTYFFKLRNSCEVIIISLYINEDSPVQHFIITFPIL